MSRRRRRAVLLAVLALYFTGLGVLAGTAVERMRFDVRRARALARYERDTERVRAHLMDLERSAEGRTSPGTASKDRHAGL